jgi:FkbM family methyltransferase
VANDIEAGCQTFELARPYSDQRFQKLKYSLYKKLTKKALPLFFKGADIISIPPLANGIYEPEITALINHLAGQKYSDFFVDIGANIGLSSCQCGANFDEVHMFEPNPDCVSILKVNAKIALKKMKFFINEYGLGAKKEKLKLYVPFDNWGGAFIKSDDNAYKQDLLSEKDGYGKFNEDNYQVLDVQIEAASEVLFELFDELNRRNKTNGVIKIDVEGYEGLVLGAIAQTVPANFKIFVIFENWASNLAFSDLNLPSSLNTKLFKIEENKKRLLWAPRWLNSMANFISGGTKVKLVPIADEINAGSYLLALESSK